jgi:hypothetical protein
LKRTEEHKRHRLLLQEEEEEEEEEDDDDDDEHDENWDNNRRFKRLSDATTGPSIEEPVSHDEGIEVRHSVKFRQRAWVVGEHGSSGRDSDTDTSPDLLDSDDEKEHHHIPPIISTHTSRRLWDLGRSISRVVSGNDRLPRSPPRPQ